MSDPIKLSSPATRQFWKITVLYEDAQLLVLDKPTDLAAVPLLDDPDRPSLLSLLHRDMEREAPWTRDRRLSFLKTPHHLEPAVGGVFVLAKDATTLKELADRFGEEKPIIDFMALVKGTPRERKYDLLIKLAANPNVPGHYRTSKISGKRSRTLIQVEEQLGKYALVTCQPLTHRKHQIEAHLRHLRLPLVGDRIYGTHFFYLSSIKPDYRLKPNKKERALISRPALHAARISFPHPNTGTPLTIESPPAKDLSVTLKYLHRYTPEAT